MPIPAIEEIDTITPEQFLARLRRLHRSHKQLVIEAMGDPPDAKNVPKSLWDKIREEEEALLLILMIGLSATLLQSMHGTVIEQVEEIQPEALPVPFRRLYRNMRRRSRWASGQVTRTTRRLLTELARNAGGTRSSTSITREVISDHRAATIARTEAVAARRIAVRSLYEELQDHGLQVQHIWRLGVSCNHCKVCPLFEGLPEWFWSRYTSIPVHPNCCCYTEIQLGSAENLYAAGIMRRPPEARFIRDALRKAKFKRRQIP